MTCMPQKCQSIERQKEWGTIPIIETKEWIWQVIATCDPGLVLGLGKKFLLKTVKGKNISRKVGKIRIAFIVQKIVL